MINSDFSKILTSHELRITSSRVLLLKLIEHEKTPVDSQFIIEKLKNELSIDKVTVFRILNILTDHGILRKLEFGESKARYELNNEDHHHLICQDCGKIEDISDCNIGALEKEINKKKKFLVKLHTLEFYGLCEDCQK